VPRSPFAHKKSQENFERKTHKRVVKAWDAHPEVVKVWIGYLRKHALGGVGMRVTTWKRAELGYGGKRVEEIQKRLADKSKGDGKKVPDAKIKGLAERIVKEELLSAAGKKDAAGVVKAP
jgi:small subunit ribosomal protein S10